MRQFGIGAASTALAMLVSGIAAAQGAAPAPGTPPPKSETTTPDRTTPATSLDDKSGNLSEKLKETGGVIRPTGDVDPGMRKPAPQTGSMPVLKPGQVPPQQVPQ